MARTVRKAEFQGSGAQFLKNAFLYLIVVTPMLSFCLMGPRWYYLCMSMSILFLPILLLAAFLVERFDGFSFDDELRKIAKPLGPGIPYNAVKRIEVNETGRLLQLFVRLGRFRRISLLYASHTRERDRVLAGLLKRFPQVTVITSRNADWKMMALTLSLILISTAVFHILLYRAEPQLGIVPQLREWTAGIERSGSVA